MSKIKAPSPVYLGPAAHDSGPGNKPIDRIVIHATVSPCIPGGARIIADYFRSEESRGSAHYVVDPAETVQVVYDSVIAWHAPPNPNSLGVELCDALISDAWDRAHADRWFDDNHQAMLRRAARLVARAGLHYGIPLVRVTDVELRAGQRGICGHDDVSRAWHQSTHWDPGSTFPWATFMALVYDAACKIRHNARKATP